MRPVITLTTDFGTSDHFVGTMKGVIAGICDDATVIDITHDVPAFNILEAALAIWPAWRFFPVGTIHVLVVDPGVGTARRPVLSRLGGHYFIAPDNGLLTLVLEDAERSGPPPLLHELTTPAYRLGTESFTFHGRDIFAPAAAHLARHMVRGNVDLGAFGPRIENITRLNLQKPARDADGVLHGEVLKSDRFGNLLTNLQGDQIAQLHDQRFTLHIGQSNISRLFSNYTAGESGVPFAILGSSGLLEIAVNRGSAATILHAGAGTHFTLTFL